MVVERTRKALEHTLGLPPLDDIEGLREVLPAMDSILKTLSEMPDDRVTTIRETLEVIKEIRGSVEELQLVHDIIETMATMPTKRIEEIRALLKDLGKVAKNLPEISKLGA